MAPPQTESADCEPVADGTEWRQDASVTLNLIDTQNGMSIYAAEYPVPGVTEGLWSQWGQGVVVSGGRHISAVGDHLGIDGNSYFFVFDPATRSLTRFMDVLSLVDHQLGAPGYGKVHAQMVVDSCGSVWAATYWGRRGEVRYGDGYEGDLLLEIDPAQQTVVNHGPIAGRRGIPSMTLSADGRTVIAEATETDRDGHLTAFDTITRSVISAVTDSQHLGFRALAAPPHGDILYSVGGGRLARYDPTSGDTSDTDLEMPGDWLRAATSPAPDGTIYGVTQDRPELFALAGDGSVTKLGDPGGYTTSLALTEQGETVYWLPDAHGAAWRTGATIRSMDTGSGEISRIVSLREPFERELGLLPGGTYSITSSSDKLYLGVNSSPMDDDSGFGTVVLVVIEGL